MSVILRPATRPDALYIGHHLRASDLHEVRCLSPDPAPDIVETSRNYSDWARTFEINGLPAVIFGVTPSPKPGWGVPWLLATDAAMAYARGLVRRCHGQVAEMQRLYPNLHNQVHRDNTTSIEWLRWLGFTIGTVPCGPADEFLLFWKR